MSFLPFDYSTDDLKRSLKPGGAWLLADLYVFYLFAYPPSSSLYRKLHLFLLGLPIGYAFIQSDQISRNYTVVDTFGRFLLIWYVNASYKLCVLEFAPVVREGTRWKERMKQAYAVLFDRNHVTGFNRADTLLPLNGDVQQYVATDKKTDEPLLLLQNTPVLPESYRHNYTRSRFVCYHIAKGLLFHTLRSAFEFYDDHYSALTLHRAHIDLYNLDFFRRLPTSLSLLELRYRAETAFEWNAISLLLYETWHSFFAVLWVGSHVNAPSEWPLALFGPISEAYSVRRFWGKHWHTYVYYALSGHVKIVTRRWLGFRRGALSTRLLENSLVFLVSGLMHSLVRWQQSPLGDPWSIALWYVGQMIPIVVEGVVVNVWRKVRKWCGFGGEVGWLDRVEYAVGYLWVFGWFMWSVPKYLNTRMKWSDAIMRRRFGVEQDYGTEGNWGNETGPED
ncbi:hypothetical protein BDW02DRAFT_410811 [Decorospora gaudefroyi]|uniref:Wax synthase domain-containing protein n=1 Tax=Decorospora gaudefroyi TaxID=184978 RepID=A0A6A5K9R1_9PLEO|nr:hypothetical protein BDW02DRAFT_410811 [Decorospora gaudefroyi]